MKARGEGGGGEGGDQALPGLCDPLLGHPHLLRLPHWWILHLPVVGSLVLPSTEPLAEAQLPPHHRPVLCRGEGLETKCKGQAQLRQTATDS